MGGDAYSIKNILYADTVVTVGENAVLTALNGITVSGKSSAALSADAEVSSGGLISVKELEVGNKATRNNTVTIDGGASLYTAGGDIVLAAVTGESDVIKAESRGTGAGFVAVGVSTVKNTVADKDLIYILDRAVLESVAGDVRLTAYVKAGNWRAYSNNESKGVDAYCKSTATTKATLVANITIGAVGGAAEIYGVNIYMHAMPHTFNIETRACAGAKAFASYAQSKGETTIDLDVQIFILGASWVETQNDMHIKACIYDYAVYQNDAASGANFALYTGAVSSSESFFSLIFAAANETITGISSYYYDLARLFFPSQALYEGTVKRVLFTYKSSERNTYPKRRTYSLIDAEGVYEEQRIDDNVMHDVTSPATVAEHNGGFDAPAYTTLIIDLFDENRSAQRNVNARCPKLAVTFDEAAKTVRLSGMEPGNFDSVIIVNRTDKTLCIDGVAFESSEMLNNLRVINGYDRDVHVLRDIADHDTSTYIWMNRYGGYLYAGQKAENVAITVQESGGYTVSGAAIVPTYDAANNTVTIPQLNLPANDVSLGYGKQGDNAQPVKFVKNRGVIRYGSPDVTITNNSGSALVLTGVETGGDNSSVTIESKQATSLTILTSINAGAGSVRIHWQAGAGGHLAAGPYTKYSINAAAVEIQNASGVGSAAQDVGIWSAGSNHALSVTNTGDGGAHIGYHVPTYDLDCARAIQTVESTGDVTLYVRPDRFYRTLALTLQRLAGRNVTLRLDGSTTVLDNEATTDAVNIEARGDLTLAADYTVAGTGGGYRIYAASFGTRENPIEITCGGNVQFGMSSESGITICDDSAESAFALFANVPTGDFNVVTPYHAVQYNAFDLAKTYPTSIAVNAQNGNVSFKEMATLSAAAAIDLAASGDVQLSGTFENGGRIGITAGGSIGSTAGLTGLAGSSLALSAGSNITLDSLSLVDSAFTYALGGAFTVVNKMNLNGNLGTPNFVLTAPGGVALGELNAGADGAVTINAPSTGGVEMVLGHILVRGCVINLNAPAGGVTIGSRSASWSYGVYGTEARLNIQAMGDITIGLDRLFEMRGGTLAAESQNGKIRLAGFTASDAGCEMTFSAPGGVAIGVAGGGLHSRVGAGLADITIPVGDLTIAHAVQVDDGGRLVLRLASGHLAAGSLYGGHIAIDAPQSERVSLADVRVGEVFGTGVYSGSFLLDAPRADFTVQSIVFNAGVFSVNIGGDLLLTHLDGSFSRIKADSIDIHVGGRLTIPDGTFDLHTDALRVFAGEIDCSGADWRLHHDEKTTGGGSIVIDTDGDAAFANLEKMNLNERTGTIEMHVGGDLTVQKTAPDGTVSGGVKLYRLDGDITVGGALTTGRIQDDYGRLRIAADSLRASDGVYAWGTGAQITAIVRGDIDADAVSATYGGALTLTSAQGSILADLIVNGYPSDRSGATADCGTLRLSAALDIGRADTGEGLATRLRSKHNGTYELIWGRGLYLHQEQYYMQQGINLDMDASNGQFVKITSDQYTDVNIRVSDGDFGAGNSVRLSLAELTINVENGSIDGAAIVNDWKTNLLASGNIFVSSGAGNLNVGEIRAGGDVCLTAGGDIVAVHTKSGSAGVTAGGDITIRAVGSILNDLPLIGDGDAADTLTVKCETADADSVLRIAGYRTLNLNGSAERISADGALRINSPDADVLVGNVSVEGALVIDARGESGSNDVTIIRQAYGRGLSIYANNVTSQWISAGAAPLVVAADGEITLLLEGRGQSVRLQAGGDIKVLGTIVSESDCLVTSDSGDVRVSSINAQNGVIRVSARQGSVSSSSDACWLNAERYEFTAAGDVGSGAVPFKLYGDTAQLFVSAASRVYILDSRGDYVALTAALLDAGNAIRISSAAALAEALGGTLDASTDTVTLTGDVALAKMLLVSLPLGVSVTVNMNGHTISMPSQSEGIALIAVESGAVLLQNGSVAGVYMANDTATPALWLGGGTLALDLVNGYANSTAVRALGGVLVLGGEMTKHAVTGMTLTGISGGSNAAATGALLQIMGRMTVSIGRAGSVEDKQNLYLAGVDGVERVVYYYETSGNILTTAQLAAVNGVEARTVVISRMSKAGITVRLQPTEAAFDGQAQAARFTAVLGTGAAVVLDAAHYTLTYKDLQGAVVIPCAAEVYDVEFALVGGGSEKYALTNESVALLARGLVIDNAAAAGYTAADVQAYIAPGDAGERIAVRYNGGDIPAGKTVEYLAADGSWGHTNPTENNGSGLVVYRIPTGDGDYWYGAANLEVYTLDPGKTYPITLVAPAGAIDNTPNYPAYICRYTGQPAVVTVDSGTSFRLFESMYTIRYALYHNYAEVELLAGAPTGLSAGTGGGNYYYAAKLELTDTGRSRFTLGTDAGKVKLACAEPELDFSIMEGDLGPLLDVRDTKAFADGTPHAFDCAAMIGGYNAATDTVSYYSDDGNYIPLPSITAAGVLTVKFELKRPNNRTYYGTAAITLYDAADYVTFHVVSDDPTIEYAEGMQAKKKSDGKFASFHYTHTAQSAAVQSVQYSVDGNNWTDTCPAYGVGDHTVFARVGVADIGTVTLAKALSIAKIPLDVDLTFTGYNGAYDGAYHAVEIGGRSANDPGIRIAYRYDSAEFNTYGYDHMTGERRKLKDYENGSYVNSWHDTQLRFINDANVWVCFRISSAVDEEYYEVIDTRVSGNTHRGLSGLYNGFAQISLVDSRTVSVQEANGNWVVTDESWTVPSYARTKINDVVIGGIPAGQTFLVKWQQIGWTDICDLIDRNPGYNACAAVSNLYDDSTAASISVTAAANGTFAFFGQTAQAPAKEGGAYVLDSLCTVTCTDDAGNALRDDFGELIQYNQMLRNIVFVPAEQTGVSVTPDAGAYDGSATYGLTVGGAASGAQVFYTYTDDDGVWRENMTTPPQFKTVGEHAVTVTVKRSDSVPISGFGSAAQTLQRYMDFVKTVAVSVTAPSDAPLVTGYSGLYDGKAHTAKVENVLAADTVAYWTDQSAARTASMPEFVQVGAYTVFYAITRGTMAFDGSVAITILEGPSAADVTVDYDGGSHALSVTNIPDGGSMAYRLSGEGEDAWTGSLARTDAGVYNIEYKLVGQDVFGTATLTINKAYQSGITAEPVRAYVGTGSYGANVTVAAADAIVRFRDASGNYTLTGSPEFAQIGVYTVDYMVTQGGNFEAFYGRTTVSILARNEMTNIVAENAVVDYDGGAHSIVVSGTLVGDTVRYWYDNGAESTTNPGFSLPGTYRVHYRVVRAGHFDDVVGSALLTINEMASDALQLAEYSDVYDGAYHGVTVTQKGGLPLALEFSTDGGNTWSKTNPQFRNVTDTVVHVRALDPSGAVMALRSARVTISPAPLAWDTSDLALQMVEYDDGVIEPRVAGELRVQGLAVGDQGQFHAGRYAVQLENETEPYAGSILYAAPTAGGNYTLPRFSRFYYSVWLTRGAGPAPGLSGGGGEARGQADGGNAQTYPWLTVTGEEGNGLPYRLLLPTGTKPGGTVLVDTYPDRDADGNVLLDAAGKPVFGVRRMQLTHAGLHTLLNQGVQTLGFSAGDALLWLPVGSLCAAVEKQANGGENTLAGAYLIVEIEPVAYDAETMPAAWAEGKRVFRIRVYLVIGDQKIDITDSIAAMSVSFLLAESETVLYWEEETETWVKADAAHDGTNAASGDRAGTVHFMPSGVFALMDEPDRA